MFKFSIRDVLWLTVVVALAVGWWIDRTRLVHVFESQVEDFQSDIALLQSQVAEWQKIAWRSDDDFYRYKKTVEDDAAKGPLIRLGTYGD